MSIEQILRQTLALLESCRLMGADVEDFAGAKQNIRACIDALEKARKEQDNHDGKDRPEENV